MIAYNTNATCVAHICALCPETMTMMMMELKMLSFVYFFFVIAVASPPDRRVTRDDIGVASAGAAANNATATGCSGSSSAASTRPRNPSSSPGRNGQLSSKFSKYYLPEIRCTVYRPDIPTSVFLQKAKFSFLFSSFFF